VHLDAEALSSRGEAVRAAPGAAGARELVSVGVPLQGVSVKVADDDGAPVAQGRVGRVFVQGPSVMRGYLGDEPATSRALRDGWLDTGDLGLVLDGELVLVGRPSSGHRARRYHAPQEFERRSRRPGLRAGCAVAVGFVPPQGETEELCCWRSWRGGPAGEDLVEAAAPGR
jgi:acyl-CoA synthetase (AMP-forming)/AMP-acid ligase II